MIEINIELFVIILFVWILVSSIVNIIVGIVAWNEPKTYGMNELFTGVVWLIIICILLVI